MNDLIMIKKEIDMTKLMATVLMDRLYYHLVDLEKEDILSPEYHHVNIELKGLINEIDEVLNEIK